MIGCRTYRGRIAASVYETLDEPSRRALERHMGRCASCRAEAQSLARLAQQIPKETPPLDRDLLPAVRKRIEEAVPSPRRIVFARPAAWAAAAAVLLAAISYVVLVLPSPESGSERAQTSPTQTASALGEQLTAVSGLMSRREYTQAVAVLRDAIEAYPEAPEAGEAQKLLADIMFEQLKWYDKAHEAYRTLAARHPEVFSTSPECIERRDLLAEAGASAYDSLYRLDAAKGRGEEAFAKFEELIGLYPATFVASLAAEEMGKLVLGGQPAPASENPRLYAMAKARERCTNPAAIGQLTLEMGLVCVDEMSNPGRARDYYNEVAGDERTVLAQRKLARDLLSSLP